MTGRPPGVRVTAGLLLAGALVSMISGCSAARPESDSATAPTVASSPGPLATGPTAKATAPATPPGVTVPDGSESGTGGEPGAPPAPADPSEPAGQPPFVQAYTSDARDSETDRPVMGPELVAAIAALREYGPSAHPETWTGISARSGGAAGVLRVYLTEPDPAVEAELRDLSGLKRNELVFERSYLSAVDAAAAAERIAQNDAAGELSGLDVVSWRTGVDGLLEVSIAGHDAATIDRLIARYGPELRVITDAPSPAA